MEPLIWVAMVVYILSFYLIVRFSRNQTKYSKDLTVKASLYSWKVWGMRTYYYRLVAGASGLITMVVIAIIMALI